MSVLTDEFYNGLDCVDEKVCEISRNTQAAIDNREYEDEEELEHLQHIIHVCNRLVGVLRGAN